MTYKKYIRTVKNYLRKGSFTTVAGRLGLARTSNGQLSYQPEQGDPRRWRSVLVISNPKSGTYFTGAILQQLGLVDTRIHFLHSLCAVDDYRKVEAVNANADSPARRTFFCFYHVPRLLELIRPGQFAVSHILPNRRDIRALRQTRTLFVFRELRSAIVSYLRYNVKGRFAHRDRQPWADMPQSPERTVAAWKFNTNVIEEARQRLRWLDTENTLPVSYEELVGDFGRDAQRACYRKIVCHASREQPHGFDYDDLIARTLNQNTFTFSGKRSDCSVAWDERCERLFLECGGEEVNRAMFAHLEEAKTSDVMDFSWASKKSA